MGQRVKPLHLKTFKNLLGRAEELLEAAKNERECALSQDP